MNITIDWFGIELRCEYSLASLMDSYRHPKNWSGEPKIERYTIFGITFPKIATFFLNIMLKKTAVENIRLYHELRWEKLSEWKSDLESKTWEVL